MYITWVAARKTNNERKQFEVQDFLKSKYESRVEI